MNIASAKQGELELLISLGSTTNAAQGVVNIKVTASDPDSAGKSGLDAPSVGNNYTICGITQTAAYVNESPSGTFN